MFMIINKSTSVNLMVKNVLISAVTIFTAFWLTACGLSSVQTQTPAQIDGITPLDEETASLTYLGCVEPSAEITKACRAQGGEVMKTGRAQCYRCVMSYADAGKACKDSADCQGACETSGEFINSGLANQIGQCASNNNPFGCRQTIEKGVAQSAICVD